MFPTNLIINADDFGLDIQRSKVIAECVREGLVHSISVLPFPETDYDHLKMLRSLLHDCPQLKVGAHLSLIETDPLLASTPRYSQVQSAPGNYQEFLAMYGLGRLSFRQIYSEWKAQIQILMHRLGDNSTLSHLDSHQHVHVLPGLWRASDQLRREFEIPRLRIPYESLGRAIGYHFPFGLGLQALALLRLWQSETEPVGFAGFFTSMCFTTASYADFPGLVLRKPGTQFELMVHPGPSHDEMEELRNLRQRFLELQTSQVIS